MTLFTFLWVTRVRKGGRGREGKGRAEKSARGEREKGEEQKIREKKGAREEETGYSQDQAFAIKANKIVETWTKLIKSNNSGERQIYLKWIRFVILFQTNRLVLDWQKYVIVL